MNSKTNKIINCILLLCALLLSLPIHANNAYYFSHINIEDGLSQNSVNCILQDTKGFMWFGTKNGLNRFDGYSFKIYTRSDAMSGLGNSTINCIAEDDEEEILWIGTDKGPYIYDPKTDKFAFLDVLTLENMPLVGNVVNICVNGDDVWILSGIGLYVYSKTGKILKSAKNDLEKFSNVVPSGIYLDNGCLYISIPKYGIVKCQDKTYSSFFKYTNDRITSMISFRNKLVAGTSSNGILVIDKLQQQHAQNLNLESIDTKEPTENPLVHNMATVNGNVWIGTENGIFIYDGAEIAANLVHSPNDMFSLSNNAVYAIMQDRDNGIWVGSYFGGIDYMSKHSSTFRKYYPTENPHSISGLRVREMCRDSQGSIWIATEDAGLNRFDTQTKQFERIPYGKGKSSLAYYNIQCLSLNGNDLWIGYYHEGIDVMDLETRKVRHYEQSQLPGSLDNNDIFSIYTDNSGRTWIGTSTGALQYNPRHDNFRKCDEIGTFYISDIQEDVDGYLWFATYNIGAIRYNPATKAIKHFSYNPTDSTSICYNRITTIFLDHANRLWFGSEDGGLCLYDSRTETFTQITTANGLPSNVVHKILEDKEHRLWISTNNGLANYDPATRTICNYNTSNGLPSKQFNYNSGISTDDGMLYFGNINGMIAFFPHDLNNSNKKQQVTLTEFKIYNQDVEIGDDAPLSEAIPYSTAVNLKHNESSFSIKFSLLDYAATETNRFAYKLEGIDKDWIYADNNQVSYSNISPGEYQFKVKANNNKNSDNNPETVLQITIMPPWWKTGIAKSIYLVLGACVCYFAFRTYRTKSKQKQIKQMEKQEQKKQEEIYHAKIDFFTNIAHEIRTPLTLIKIPLDAVLNGDSDAHKTKDYLQIIKRNTDRLYDLINQLLDFRKTESKIRKLHMEEVDINTLISETLVRFKPTMEQNGLTINLSLPEIHINAVIDKEAITKVCSNLFTNTIKYAKSYVNISLSKNDKFRYFEIRVSNDGQPIPQEYRKKIFEAFFQVGLNHNPQRSGSGLGLALAQSLVQLHNGRIFVDNDAPDTSFVVQIPIGQQAVQENADAATPTLPEQEPTATEEDEKKDNSQEIEAKADKTMTQRRYSVLVAEDNEELLKFIADTLSHNYTVHTASNGAEALKILETEKIDVVVSDIIMPIMDGIDLCNNITSNLQMCHIPVILLTARTNIDSKITALKNGAAAYIEKPFAMEMLEAQIENLIKNHNKLRENFAQNPFIDSMSMARNKTDEKFLNKLTDIILANLDVENFNVDELASEMNMSRTSLHRKLKEISGLTPGDFIRVMRLKKAAQLLQNGEYRINEICILVGFHSQSYFTKSFQKQFGVLPKQFAKSAAQQGPLI